MAVDLIMRRDGYALKPTDAYSHELMMNIRTSDDIMAKITVPRNLKQHQVLWVMLNKVAENHPSYRDGAAVLRDIKLRLGMIKPNIIVDHKTGAARTIYTIDSTSFMAMDQVTFQKFMNDAKDTILEFILPGVSSDELFGEVMEML